MKRFFYFFSFVLVALTSCDVIEGPYDEKIIVPEITSDTVQRILLEDFTGHTCGNCPCAAETAYELDTTYKGRVIVVATHAGFFAEPYAAGTKFRADYRTEVGNQVDSYFQISAVGLPKGMVNRSEFDNKTVLNDGAWASAIAAIDTTPNSPVLLIDMEASYAASSRTVTMEVNLDYLKTGNNNHQLVVYVVEDSIINWQKFYSGTVCNPGAAYDKPDFVHRHVLRDVVNGTWGEAVYSTGTTIPVGYKTTKNFSYTINPDWNSDHIAFVAFVQDNATRRVIQVEELKLK
jgi:hypothetical protein